MAIRGADSTFQISATPSLAPARATRATGERPASRSRLSPARLARGLMSLAYVASPFRLDAVERNELGGRSSDEMAMQLNRIGLALDDAMERSSDPETVEAFTIGRALVGDIAERFQLAAGAALPQGDSQ